MSKIPEWYEEMWPGNNLVKEFFNRDCRRRFYPGADNVYTTMNASIKEFSELVLQYFQEKFEEYMATRKHEGEQVRRSRAEFAFGSLVAVEHMVNACVDVGFIDASVRDYINGTMRELRFQMSAEIDEFLERAQRGSEVLDGRKEATLEDAAQPEV